MKKIKREEGGHKGYDYRNTINIFRNQGFKVIKVINYPYKFFSYGKIILLEKK